jgi:metal-dependent amidase/aminoacylase/carboxypeptidase family protein
MVNFLIKSIIDNKIEIIYSEAAPPNWEIKQLVANDMSNVIMRNTGARYRTGSKFNLAGAASGTSTDFATVSSEMPYAYTIYAMPSGEFGWDVEEWRINPIIDQVFSAVDDMARHLIFSPTDKK